MLDQTFSFQRNVVELSQLGLNLSAVFDVPQLPSAITQVLCQNDIELDKYSSLVLLGNGGTAFWDALDRSGIDQPDPIDRFSLDLTQQLINCLTPDSQSSAEQHLILYPQTDFIIPLQQLGELAGWGTPSPIGNSIHAEFGLWFAFRSAFLTTVSLPATIVQQRPSPCETCIDKPCQKACPAGAVLENVRQFKLGQCLDYRLTPKSACASSCLARQACPIGVEHQYPDWAIQQLYGSSLASIHAWRAQNRK
ncbi:MAG: hypothetical protein AB8G95_24410 [Anaerolineae bacterium]